MRGQGICGDRSLDCRAFEATFVLYNRSRWVIDARTGRVFGIEALLRWEHPEKGFISPAVFVPVAEDSGQIIPLSLWVLDTACAQLRQLPFPLSCTLPRHPSNRPPPMSRVISAASKTPTLPISGKPGALPDVGRAIQRYVLYAKATMYRSHLTALKANSTKNHENSGSTSTRPCECS